jgi:hypothetical protein
MAPLLQMLQRENRLHNLGQSAVRRRRCRDQRGAGSSAFRRALDFLAGRSPRNTVLTDQLAADLARQPFRSVSGEGRFRSLLLAQSPQETRQPRARLRSLRHTGLLPISPA